MSEPCCEYRESGMGQLTAMVIFCHAHTAAPKYTAPQFMYCPWCGKPQPWNDSPALAPPAEGEALEALEARVNYLETADAVHKLNAQNMYEYQLKLEARLAHLEEFQRDLLEDNASTQGTVGDFLRRLATLEQIAGYGSAAAPAGQPGRGERSGEGEGR